MTNFKSVDRIISAKDYGGSARGYIRKQQEALHRGRGIAVTIKDLDKDPTGTPVVARIWKGQWIADCECRGASFVDPDEPIFFCFGCGNRELGQRPRPVTFPVDWKEIERLLLERPVNDIAGLTDMERAGMAQAVLFVEVTITEDPKADVLMESPQSGEIIKPRRVVRTLPLVRSWEPGETVDQLRMQQEEPIKEWHKRLKLAKVRDGI
jgi:hypothetical protein